MKSVSQVMAGLAFAGLFTGAGIRNAGATIYGWGDNTYNQSAVSVSDFVGAKAVAAGYWHSLVVEADGSVRAWGLNVNGQAEVPDGASNAVAVAGGRDHSLVLRADGTVLAWGSGTYGQTSLPPGLSGVAAIAAGGFHNLALLSNGTVQAWGYGFYGQTTVPGDLSGVCAVAAGNAFSLALCSNGTVRGWGDNFYHQIDIPADLTNAVAVAAGFSHALALRADGTVTMWGDTSQGQGTVPADLIHAVAVAAGGMHSLVLTADGEVIGWGADDQGQASPPGWVQRPIGIAAGFEHSLARGDDTLAVIQEPEDIVADVGDRRGINMETIGAMPVYIWYFNGTPIPNSNTNRIWFPGLTPAHAGYYFCIITNEISSTTSRTATVTVTTPGSSGIPVILAQPDNQAVDLGATAVFSVTATGAVPLVHQWRHDGIAIPEATSSNLTLANVQAEHIGSYNVIVFNALGAVTSVTATLSLRQPPVFVEHPQNVMTTAGARVTFRCSVTGTPPIHCVWYFNDVPIAFNTNVLVRWNVTMADAGNYYVIASSESGAVTSQVATLEVVNEPEDLAPVITRQPGDQQVASGGTASFEVGAKGAALLQYQWRFGVNLIEGATGATHLVTGVGADHEGFYSAIVSNGFGAVTSRLAMLSLAIPPEITEHPQGGNVPYGSRVEMRVNAAGSLPMGSIWQRDGVPVGGGAMAMPFVIASATLNDSGSYRVIVTNRFGAATSHVAVLTVYTNGLAVTPVRFVSGGAEGRLLRLSMVLEAGCNYRVQTTTNLEDWTDVTNFLSGSESADYLGIMKSNDVTRFYRVISP